jgi:hypothetical protein
MRLKVVGFSGYTRIVRGKKQVWRLWRVSAISPKIIREPAQESNNSTVSSRFGIPEAQTYFHLNLSLLITPQIVARRVSLFKNA